MSEGIVYVRTPYDIENEALATNSSSDATHRRMAQSHFQSILEHVVYTGRPANKPFVVDVSSRLRRIKGYPARYEWSTTLGLGLLPGRPEKETYP